LELLENAATAREGIEAWLRSVVASFTGHPSPRGCLMTLGATNCSSANKGPEELLRSLRKQMPAIIAERIRRGINSGELSPDVDALALAEFYSTIAQGLALRAGDGASRKALTQVIDGAMAAWPSMTEPPRAGRASNRRNREARG
jgi:hypothetical protein